MRDKRRESFSRPKCSVSIFDASPDKPRRFLQYALQFRLGSFIDNISELAHERTFVVVLAVLLHTLL